MSEEITRAQYKLIKIQKFCLIFIDLGPGGKANLIFSEKLISALRGHSPPLTPQSPPQLDWNSFIPITYNL